MPCHSFLLNRCGRKYRKHPSVKRKGIVIKFYDSIADQFRKGASWKTIADLIGHTGHKISQYKLHEFYLIEKKKREKTKKNKKNAAG